MQIFLAHFGLWLTLVLKLRGASGKLFLNSSSALVDVSTSYVSTDDSEIQKRDQLSPLKFSMDYVLTQ